MSGFGVRVWGTGAIGSRVIRSVFLCYIVLHCATQCYIVLHCAKLCYIVLTCTTNSTNCTVCIFVFLYYLVVFAMTLLVTITVWPVFVIFGISVHWCIIWVERCDGVGGKYHSVA